MTVGLLVGVFRFARKHATVDLPLNMRVGLLAGIEITRYNRFASMHVTLDSLLVDV